MDPNRLIRIRWSNHKGSLISTFDDLFAKESMVDVTLTCGGEVLKAHKLVLCACSPYFEELISVDSSKHPIIFMRDTQFSELKALIGYMYRGEVQIAEDKLQSLILLAQRLKIRGLSQLETNSANPATTDPPETEPTTPHSNSEPETIENDEKEEETPSPSIRISSISSTVAAAGVVSSVDLLPTSGNNLPPFFSNEVAARKRKKIHSPKFDVGNPLHPQPGLHYHAINLEENSSGSGFRDIAHHKEIGDSNEDGHYFDPLDVAICDFQDEEGHDSNMSSGEWGSENEEMAEDDDCVDEDGEQMPFRPTVALDAGEETMDPDRLGMLREMKIVSNRRGRKTICERFQCPNPGCGRFYSQKSSLKRHLDFECYKPPQFSCPHCGLKSKLRGNSELHARRCKFRTPVSAAGREIKRPTDHSSITSNSKIETKIF